MEEYDVYSDFDIDKHKQHFVNYCEVIITPDGKVHYAVPSHQGFMERYGAAEKGMSLDDFIYSCPEDMYARYLEWLMLETGCIPCWGKGYIGDPNPRQKAALIRLFEAGLVVNNKMPM